MPGFRRRLDGWRAALGDAEAVPAPGGAGDLVIRRHDLSHGTSRNAAGRPRMAQSVDVHPPAMAHKPVWLRGDREIR